MNAIESDVLLLKQFTVKCVNQAVLRFMRITCVDGQIGLFFSLVCLFHTHTHTHPNLVMQTPKTRHIQSLAGFSFTPFKFFYSKSKVTISIMCIEINAPFE